MMGAPGRPTIPVPAGPEPAKPGVLAAINGYKTYILVGLGFGIVGLNIAGFITADQMNHMLDALGLGAIATLRSAIAGNAAAIAKTTDAKP